MLAVIHFASLIPSWYMISLMGLDKPLPHGLIRAPALIPHGRGLLCPCFFLLLYDWFGFYDDLSYLLEFFMYWFYYYDFIVLVMHSIHIYACSSPSFWFHGHTAPIHMPSIPIFLHTHIPLLLRLTHANTYVCTAIPLNICSNKKDLDHVYIATAYIIAVMSAFICMWKRSLPSMETYFGSALFTTYALGHSLINLLPLFDPRV